MDQYVNMFGMQRVMPREVDDRFSSMAIWVQVHSWQNLMEISVVRYTMEALV